MSNPITGNAKVLYKNYLIDYSNTITVSSGDATKSYLYDLDRDTRWISSSSSDAIMEIITIVFDSAQTINALAFLNMNWKEFAAYYLDGSSVWTPFSNAYSEINNGTGSGAYGGGLYGTTVYGINGRVAYSDNAENSRYFEFDAVSTTQIRIEIMKTITANAEKYCYELYVGKTIGTFVEDICCAPNSVEPISRVGGAIYLEKSNLGVIKIERGDKYRVKLNISELWETGDQDIIDTMYTQGEFVIYPCGGGDQYTLRGWRLQDFYHVSFVGDLPAGFAIGRDSNMGYNYQFELHEI